MQITNKKHEGINVRESPYSKNNYWLNLLEIDQKIIKVKISKLIKELNREGLQLRTYGILIIFKNI